MMDILIGPIIVASNNLYIKIYQNTMLYTKYATIPFLYINSTSNLGGNMTTKVTAVRTSYTGLTE